MEIILLHSNTVEASRALVASCNLDPVDAVDEIINRDGFEVRLVGNHEVAVGLCNSLSSYPTVLVDGRATPVQTWDDVMAAITAPAPLTPVRTISQFAFSRLFTKAERIAIRQAAKVNADVEDFVDILDRAGVVDLDYQETVEGVNAMEDEGLIGPGRAARILANLPPIL